jgi:hypothetical protein
VVEHCVDIAGVASSILATPTIFFSKISSLARCAREFRLGKFRSNGDRDLAFA